MQRSNTTSFISAASLWSTDVELGSSWSESAPFMFWLIDVARPRRLISIGKSTFGAHLIYCQAVERLGLETSCLAVHSASIPSDEADDQFVTSYEKYHNIRYGRFSQLTCNEPLATSGGFGDVDLVHTTAVADIQHYRATLSQRCVVVIQGGEAARERFASADHSPPYPAFSLRVGQELAVVGFGQTLPTEVCGLLKCRADERLLIADVYARLGSTNRSEALRLPVAQLGQRSRSDEGSGRPVDGVAVSKIKAKPSGEHRVSPQDDFALFRRLLWLSARREDSLTVELEGRKDVERRQARVESNAARSMNDLDGAREVPVNRYVARLTSAMAVPEEVNATVSVVIPTFNAGKEFYWLLKKLRDQQGVANLEIVIVDSGSKDDTIATALDFDCRVIQIESDLFSHSFARNLGADVATGHYLIFMVQDAFPIGYSWISDLLKALLTPLNNGEYLAALSCAEHPRRDSELMYNISINSHYQFLGCFDKDKVGYLTNFDHQSLRTQGQLSDVTCLISRRLFLKYRHYGRYGEDLLLGIRLIKDGYHTAMLSSIKVIHSHFRPLGYYVRRAFVDVVFLCDVFSDFLVPTMSSASAIYAAAVASMQLVPKVSPSAVRTPGSVLENFVSDLTNMPMPTEFHPSMLSQNFDNPAIADWIGRLTSATRTAIIFSSEQLNEMRMFRDMLCARIVHLKGYVEEVHLVLDADTKQQLTSAVIKTIGMTLGAALAFYYLNRSKMAEGSEKTDLVDLHQILLAGV